MSAAGLSEASGGEVHKVGKRYIHVLRPLLAARWMEEHSRSETGQRETGGGPPHTPAAQRLWPPLDSRQLIDETAATTPEEIRGALAQMLEPSERHAMGVPGPRRPLLDAFIEAELKHAASAPSVPPRVAARALAEEAFDELCVAMISPSLRE